MNGWPRLAAAMEEGAGAALPDLPLSTVEIGAASPVRPIDVAELWAYRELLYFLVWRDIKVRYKQTALGAAWAILQPVLTMAVFSVFLGRLARVPSDGLPYPLFSFAALVPWTYFATTITNGANSVVGSQQLITKIYFPRLLIPLAATFTPLVDFAIALLTIAPLMWWYGVMPSAALVWLPAFIVLAALTGLATTVWLATLTVRFRDVRYVVPFVVQFWMFATPVAYPASLVPERWRLLYGLNPMAAVIEGCRWSLVGGRPPGVMTLVAIVVVLGMLASGLAFFRSAESTFADVI